jgi:hypothetical protein
MRKIIIVSQEKQINLQELRNHYYVKVDNFRCKNDFQFSTDQILLHQKMTNKFCHFNN